MSTNFGVITTGTPNINFSPAQDIAIAKALGVEYVRNSIRLDKWDGKADKGVDTYLAAGFKVLLNINEKIVNKDAAGNKIPNPIPKDLTKWKAGVESIMKIYGNRLYMVVFENEITNKSFYSGPMSDYLRLLAAGKEICAKYGVKVTDSCVHIELVLSVMQGRAGQTSEGNASKVKELIDGIKKMNTDCWNVHTHGEGKSYPNEQIKKVADYLRSQKNMPVICNEFGIHSNEPSLVDDMMRQFNEAGVEIAILYNGGIKEGKARAIVDDSGVPNSLGMQFIKTASLLKIIPPSPEQLRFRELWQNLKDIGFFELFNKLSPESADKVAEIIEIGNTL